MRIVLLFVLTLASCNRDEPAPISPPPVGATRVVEPSVEPNPPPPAKNFDPPVEVDIKAVWRTYGNEPFRAEQLYTGKHVTCSVRLFAKDVQKSGKKWIAGIKTAGIGDTPPGVIFELVGDLSPLEKLRNDTPTEFRVTGWVRGVVKDGVYRGAVGSEYRVEIENATLVITAR